MILEYHLGLMQKLAEERLLSLGASAVASFDKRMAQMLVDDLCLRANPEAIPAAEDKVAQETSRAKTETVFTMLAAGNAPLHHHVAVIEHLIAIVVEEQQNAAELQSSLHSLSELAAADLGAPSHSIEPTVDQASRFIDAVAVLIGELAERLIDSTKKVRTHIRQKVENRVAREVAQGNSSIAIEIQRCVDVSNQFKSPGLLRSWALDRMPSSEQLAAKDLIAELPPDSEEELQDNWCERLRQDNPAAYQLLQKCWAGQDALTDQHDTEVKAHFERRVKEIEDQAKVNVQTALECALRSAQLEQTRFRERLCAFMRAG